MTAEAVPTLDERAEILAWLDEKPSLSRHVVAARRLDALDERTPGLFARARVVVLRNFTVEPVEPLLRVTAYRSSLRVDLVYSGYDPAAEGLDALLSGGDHAIVVALRLEELVPAWTKDFVSLRPADASALADEAVDHLVSLVGRVRAASRAPVLVHNFVMPLVPPGGLADAQEPRGQLNLVRAMNARLAHAFVDADGVYVVDIDHALARAGLVLSVDERGERVSDSPLSQTGLRVMAETDVRHILALSGARVKCVVVDCDNTLWGGLIGEEGLDGIVLGATGAGRRYRDVQQSLLHLRRRGFVLAISSKNEEADVRTALRTHPDFVVREEDFAAMRIDWNDKAENIVAIAAELNLRLEHVAFVDDNPVECEWVRSRLPEVTVLQWPAPGAEVGLLHELPIFDSLVVTDEDRARTEMYHAESSRREARERVSSREEYLRGLDMVATIGLARAEHVQRLAQLTQRTNQFNLTTRRYDVSAMRGMAEDPLSRVVWLRLSDRFGDSGMVGCGILHTVDGDAHVDTLLLSCRVIGRGVEFVLLNHLAALAGDMGARTLVGEFVPSERNAQVADLYTRVDFAGPDDDGARRVWRWSLASGLPPVPEWFRVVNVDASAA